MKLPPKKKGISAQFMKLIAYDPLHGLSHPPKHKKRKKGGRVGFADGGAPDYTGMAADQAPQATPDFGRGVRRWLTGDQPYGRDEQGQLPEVSLTEDPISRSISSVASIPQRAIEGAQQDFEHRGEAGYQSQAAGPAFEAAMTLAGQAPLAKPGTAGIFGGRLSQTADKGAFTRAESLERAGVSPEEIWRREGVTRGADSQWRNEIDDSKSAINPSSFRVEDGRVYFNDPKSTAWRPDGALRLNEALDHPELFDAYPSLSSLRVAPLSAEDIARGIAGQQGVDTLYMQNGLPIENFRSTLLHEGQHSIQDIENFARGDNPINHMPSRIDEAKSVLAASQKPLIKELAEKHNTNDVGVEYMKTLVRNELNGANFPVPEGHARVFRQILERHPEDKERILNIVKSEELIRNAERKAFSTYHNAMGEVEARNTQARINLPAEDRRQLLPSGTEDVPREQQRAVYPRGEYAAAPAMAGRLSNFTDIIEGRAKSRFDPIEKAEWLWQATKGKPQSALDLLAQQKRLETMRWTPEEIAKGMHGGRTFEEWQQVEEALKSKFDKPFVSQSKLDRVSEHAQDVLDNKGAVTVEDLKAKFPKMDDQTLASIAQKYARKPGRASGGSVQHMADGGVPAFDETRGSDQVPAFDETRGADKTNSGWSSYLPRAISDVPHEVYEAGAQQVRNIGQAWTDIRARHAAQAEMDSSSEGSFFDPSAMMGSLKDVGDTGKAVVSAASALPAALVQGPARSLIGHPMADAEHIIGTIINPKVAAQDNPDEMYEKAKGDVDLAMSAARPRGMAATQAPGQWYPRITPVAPEAGVVRGPYEISETAPSYEHSINTSPPTSPFATPEAQANRAAASEFQVPLSRGQATQDLDRIRYEDMAARGAYGPEAQERAAKFFNDQFESIQRAGRGVGETFGHGEQPIASPADAAASVNMTVGEQAAAARQARDAVVTNAEREAAAQRQMSTDRETAITQSIAGNHPQISAPRDAGEIVSQNLRGAATAHRDEFRGLYNEFGNLPGEFNVSAVRGMGSRVRQDLTYSDNPVVIDEGTPAASRAIQALDQMSQPRITNLADPLAPPSPAEVSSVNLRGIDQMRKRLVAYYQQARSSNNASDIRATRSVLNGFDDQIEGAIRQNLFSGDPRALQALQEARASFSRYQRLYNPRGASDDVGTAMRRIVDRNATPEETANLIIGSGKIGTSGAPVRIADRLEEILGADSPAWSSIRQAMWRKASQIRTSAGEVDPAKSAASITDFSNSTLARRMFSPEELRAMRGHAQGVRDLDRLIETMPETTAAEGARTAYEAAFGGENLAGSQRAAFRRMVDGTATPEETAQAIFSSIGGGNSGNTVRALNAIEDIVGPDSPAMGAVRQGVWQKLTQNPFGKDPQGQQKMMQGINEFLNGKGREIARTLYTADERALMNRYAEVVRKTIIPKYARTNSDTAPAMLAAARKYAGAIGSAIGMGIHGGAGGLEGYAVAKLLDKAVEKIGAARQAKKLNDTLEDIIPPARKALPPPSAKTAAKILPLSAHGGPGTNIGQTIARLQGPTPGRADNEKPKTNRPVN